jgi:hypothetical protein
VYFDAVKTVSDSYAPFVAFDEISIIQGSCRMYIREDNRPLKNEFFRRSDDNINCDRCNNQVRTQQYFGRRLTENVLADMTNSETTFALPTTQAITTTLVTTVVSYSTYEECLEVPRQPVSNYQRSKLTDQWRVFSIGANQNPLCFEEK